MEMNQPAISGTGLHHSYRENRAVVDVSFEVRGGVTGLLGPNGAGKSTLLNILATAIVPDGGQLRILGLSPDNSADRREIRRRLGFMPQSPGFYPNFSLEEFIEYMAILKEMSSRRDRRAETDRVLALVDLEKRRRSTMKSLSGGMLRRAALAVALLGDPQVLILDEPTVGLDPEQRLRLRELIADLGETRTVILSTHQTEDVMSLCHEVIVMHRGGLVFSGGSADLKGIADGRVWLSAERAPDALACWRLGSGQYRSIGDPPPGSQLLEATLEDGYMILVGGLRDEEEVAA
jgi:ABC-2 type transport system ATP-binding protein